MPGRIVYHCTARHAYTLDRWFDVISKSADDSPDIVIETYDSLHPDSTVRPGTHVFTDADRMSAKEMQMAVTLARRVGRAGPGHAIANWPNAIRNRCELLTLLHRHGRNSFRCMRLEAVPDDLRYPVFLRLDHAHKGPATPLLHDAAELAIALRKLLVDQAVRRDDVLVVEYVDSDRLDGAYVKYAAYCAFGEVRPANVPIATHWAMKAGSRVRTDAAYATEIAYARDNPRCTELAEIFTLAQIDFGRIDYTLRQGRIEVFEINTNPDLLSARALSDPERRNAYVVPWQIPAIAATFRRRAAASEVGVDSAAAPAWGTQVYDLLWGEARHRLYAERGRVPSQVALATMHAMGEGAEQDSVQAWRWFDIAADQLEGAARDTATAARDRVGLTMTPQQLEEARRLVAAWWTARGGVVWSKR